MQDWIAAITITVEEPEDKLEIWPKSLSLTYPVAIKEDELDAAEERLSKACSVAATFDSNGVILQCNLLGFPYQEITLGYVDTNIEEIDDAKDYVLEHVTTSFSIVLTRDEDRENVSEE